MGTFFKIVGVLCTVFFVVLLATFGYLYSRNQGRLIIPSVSMAPTVAIGDTIEVNYHAYDKAEPRAGEIVVYLSSEDKTKHLARIVAIAGEKVSFPMGLLYINGKAIGQSPRKVKSPYPDIDGVFEENTESLGEKTYNTWTVPGIDRFFKDFLEVGPDQFFVAGDNRDNAKDSRYVGPILRSQIIGRAEKIVDSKYKDHIDKSL